MFIFATKKKKKKNTSIGICKRSICTAYHWKLKLGKISNPEKQRTWKAWKSADRKGVGASEGALIARFATETRLSNDSPHAIELTWKLRSTCHVSCWRSFFPLLPNLLLWSLHRYYISVHVLVSSVAVFSLSSLPKRWLQGLCPWLGHSLLPLPPSLSP